MKQIIKRLEENLNEYQPDLCMEGFLSIKPIKEISREKVNSFDWMPAPFQVGHRWAEEGSLDSSYPRRE